MLRLLGGLGIGRPSKLHCLESESYYNSLHNVERGG